MKKYLLPILFLAAPGATFRIPAAPKPAVGQPAQTEFEVWQQAANSPQTYWVAKSLKEMQTIKVGMTRGQLLKVFTGEGGLSSAEWRRYVYRECPYIKVDVNFRPVESTKGINKESPDDVITKISTPFLEWSIMD